MRKPPNAEYAEPLRKGASAGPSTSIGLRRLTRVRVIGAPFVVNHIPRGLDWMAAEFPDGVIRPVRADLTRRLAA